MTSPNPSEGQSTCKAAPRTAHFPPPQLPRTCTASHVRSTRSSSAYINCHALAHERRGGEIRAWWRPGDERELGNHRPCTCNKVFLLKSQDCVCELCNSPWSAMTLYGTSTAGTGQEPLACAGVDDRHPHWAAGDIATTGIPGLETLTHCKYYGVGAIYRCSATINAVDAPVQSLLLSAKICTSTLALRWSDKHNLLIIKSTFALEKLTAGNHHI
ncbi:hypothetical protein EDC01DRAFT_60368 [Geopyxis carbonaria]|nr:hypothetical protein EDC01DRAFT_60368 [Geopyxis carbonaria]